jgi:GDP-D-mannose dehydratase
VWNCIHFNHDLPKHFDMFFARQIARALASSAQEYDLKNQRAMHL